MVSGLLGKTIARARDALSARFGYIEWVLLAAVVLLPTAFIWHFASPGYFLSDDFHNLYWASNADDVGSFLFGASYSDHLSPGHRLVYLVLQRVAPMNFDVAVAFLLLCHAGSAVLLQRILALFFGRVWWTYALTLAWAMSVVYVAGFLWFAAGLHSIPATTATLASIHGYLCWWTTGRRGWLWWSLGAMCIGLAFYVKALLIPVYLVLIRALILEPDSRVRDSLRSLVSEWRVWVAYAAVCVAFLVGYVLGDYSQYQPDSTATVGEILRYLRLYWFDGLWPMVFGVRVPVGAHGVWYQVAIVGAQVALISVVVWSVARRRGAWRVWVFLLAAVAANALIVVGRVSQFGSEGIAHLPRYFLEPTLLLGLALAFAVATPRLTSRASAVGSTVPADEARHAPPRRPDASPAAFRGPGLYARIAVLLGLAAYVTVSWAAADALVKSSPSSQEFGPAGRLTRTYFENLRADIIATRRRGIQPTLVDHDVPDTAIAPLTNLKPAALQAGVRPSALSSVLPLFGDEVKFNQTGPLFVVRPDGHLQRTHFVRAAGGPPADLRRGGSPADPRGARGAPRWRVVRRCRRPKLPGVGAASALARARLVAARPLLDRS